MKKHFKIFIGVAILLLLFGGVALATSQIWSATTSITIITPDGGGGGGGGGGSPPPPPPPPLSPPPLEVTSISISDRGGVLEDGVWSANLTQGVGGSLQITIRNPRSSVAQIEMLVDGVVVVEEDGFSIIVATPAPGTTLTMGTSANTLGNISANGSETVMWSFHVDNDAQVGALPNISLEVREK